MEKYTYIADREKIKAEVMELQAKLKRDIPPKERVKLATRLAVQGKLLCSLYTAEEKQSMVDEISGSDSDSEDWF